jgi:hypothetical protein
MRSPDKILCWTYGLISLAALIATWSQNIRFFTRSHDNGGWDFLTACYANPAAGSITNDILLLTLAAWVFMVVESRRLGVRHVWAYILGCLLVASSVAVPLFLLARQRRLAGESRVEQGL